MPSCSAQKEFVTCMACLRKLWIISRPKKTRLRNSNSLAPVMPIRKGGYSPMGVHRTAEPKEMKKKTVIFKEGALAIRKKRPPFSGMLNNH